MPQASLPFLPALDETSRLLLAFPWQQTTLGPIDGWPAVLKTTVALIMATPAPIVTLWGEDGYMIYNDAYRVFAGGRHPTLLGSKVREGWPEVADFNDNVMRVGLAGGTLSYQDQELTLHRSGAPEQVWMNLDYSPIRDQDGNIAGVMAVVVETSGKVKAERRVRAERERLNTMFEQAPGFICLLEGSEHRYALANDAYRKLIGPRPLLGLPVHEAVPELAEQGIVEALDACFASGEAVRAEGVPLTLRALEGGATHSYIDFVLQPLKDSNGAVFATFVEGNDVTERVTAERALRASEERFRTFAQAMPNHVWAARADGSAEWFNEQVFEYAGLAPDALLGHGWTRLLHPDDAMRYQAHWQASVASGTPFEIEVRLRRADGAWRWHLVRARISPGEDGRQAGSAALWIGSSIDIEDQKRASDALASINASLEQRVERRTAERDRMWRLSKDIMMVADHETTLYAMNPAFTQILGWSEAETLGTSYLELVHPDDREPTRRQVAELQAGGQVYRFENRWRRKNGSWCHLSWTASPDQDYVHAVGRDISADLQQLDVMRRTEAALQQAQKMETIGKLTGGVAHDFNNLLQVIGGNLQLIGRTLDKHAEPMPDIRKRVDSAMSGVERGAKLASSLLSFARRQPLEPRAVKISRLLAGMEDMMRRALGEEIDIETIVSGGLWTTEVDPAQIENAILNLAINARDAMDGAGKLTIEVNNAALDDQYCATHPEVAPGQYVLLAVSDTGSGMPQDVIDQAFEPFFSTKPEGKGTGLGLSMVYGLVKQSGGHVKIYSEVGEGTTVKIYLPRSYGAEDHPGEQLAQPAAGGHETVLVVEDDEQVRLTVVDLLTDLGYRVLRAGDASAALTVIDSGVHIDLLFTDVVMPGPLRSPDLARKARERLPEVAVLFTSGYTENAIVHGGRLDPGVELLGKPYTRDALARKVRHVLANQQQKNRGVAGALNAPAASSAAPAASDAGFKARVLLVEDDADIRDNTAELVRLLGYEVLEADCAEAALELLARRPGIVLTDLQLPGMHGEELARLVKERLPAARVAIVSGGSERPEAADAWLGKPYDAAQLGALLERLA